MDVRQPHLRLSRSIVGEQEATAVSRVILEDGYLGMGSEVQAFEAELAGFLGLPADRVACVNSGTAALHLAVQATLNPGDEVLVQSLTFVATFQAISAAGAIPLACEILPGTLTIDLDDAARRVTSRTRAIIPVHYAGNPGDLGDVYDFATRHGLRVIEDAAHAFGCRYRGKLVGTLGDISCFSFDGIKNITSGEGGAVVSSDGLVMSRVKDARLLGVERDTEQRYAGGRSWEFDVTRQGYRYHMSNLFAAIGRVQLRRFMLEFAPKRVGLAQQYQRRLEGIPGVILLDMDLGAVVPHIYPVRISGGRRNALRDALEEAGVETGLHYKPNHLLTLYGGGRERLPVTERIFDELLTLPLHPGLRESDVDAVCAVVERVLVEGKSP